MGGAKKPGQSADIPEGAPKEAPKKAPTPPDRTPTLEASAEKRSEVQEISATSLIAEQMKVVTALEKDPKIVSAIGEVKKVIDSFDTLFAKTDKLETDEEIKKFKAELEKAIEALKASIEKLKIVISKTTATSTEIVSRSIKGLSNVIEIYDSFKKDVGDLDNKEQIQNFKTVFSQILTTFKKSFETKPKKEGKEEEKKEEKKLPRNKWSTWYYAAKDEIEKNPDFKKSPLAAGLLAVLGFMAKYGSIFENISPSGFIKSLKEEDSTYVNEKFSDDDSKKLLEQYKEERRLKEEEQKALEALKDAEKASTKYVSILLGIEPIDDAKVLASRLLYSEKEEGHKYYESFEPKDFSKLQKIKEIPKGTVIFFKKKMMSVETMVAYATGDGQIFKYYDLESKSEKTIDLSKDISKAFSFKAGFIPRFNTDPAKPREDIDTEIDESPSGRVMNVVKKVKESNGIILRKLNLILPSTPPSYRENYYKKIFGKLSEGKTLLEAVEKIEGLIPEMEKALKEAFDQFAEAAKKTNESLQDYKKALEEQVKKAEEEKKPKEIEKLKANLKQVEKFLNDLKKYLPEEEATETQVAQTTQETQATPEAKPPETPPENP